MDFNALHLLEMKTAIKIRVFEQYGVNKDIGTLVMLPFNLGFSQKLVEILTNFFQKCYVLE